MDITTLRAMGTPRGRLLHLVQLGEGRTLCGQPTGMNPMYLDEKFGYTSHPSKTDCRRCKAVVGVEIPAEVETVESLTAKIEKAEARMASLRNEIRATSHHRRRTSLIAERDEVVEYRDELVAERDALQVEAQYLTNDLGTHRPTDKVELGYTRRVCKACGTDWMCPEAVQHRDARIEREGQALTAYTVDCRDVFTIHKGGCQHVTMLDDADRFDFASAGATAAEIEHDGDEAVGEPQSWAFGPCLPTLRTEARA